MLPHGGFEVLWDECFEMCWLRKRCVRILFF